MPFTNPVLGGGPITSGFGGRSAPKVGASTNHKGIDVGGTIGTPVIAPEDLRITYAGQAKGYGNVIYAMDGNGYEHRFAHLNDISVRQGQILGAGTQLGTLGATGNVTGPHLHYETRKDGIAIDPASLVSAGKNLVGRAKKLFSGDTARAGAAVVTGGASEAVFGVTDGLGLTGDCNWICQLKKYISESGFFQRLALAILAFIMIAAAFFLIKSNQILKG